MKLAIVVIYVIVYNSIFELIEVSAQFVTPQQGCNSTVEINVVVVIAGNNSNVSVEVQYYLMTNSAAFLAMLAAVESKMEK